MSLKTLNFYLFIVIYVTVLSLKNYEKIMTTISKKIDSKNKIGLLEYN